jgi:DNA-binding LytR/AlgR family response regulator
MNPRAPTALIAEDEPLLAQVLQAELAIAWPELNVVAIVGDGLSAVQKALALKPDVLFFDIQMPGLTGLEAAGDLADAWQGNDFPSLVFVTAYDQFAVQAFEAQAVDYLLKPVQAARLQKTVSKLKQRLTGNSPLDATINQLRQLLQPPVTTAVMLHTIPASTAQGNVIRMIPIADVLYFEAADKYIRVFANQNGDVKEYLIRTPLKELLQQLDAVFWQIHRGIVVRSTAIESVSRDEAGKLSVHLANKRGTLPVSRLYTHLFKAM